MRIVHRGVPDPGADDDQLLRDGRRQPLRHDLRQRQAAGAAAPGHAGAATCDGPRRHRRGLLPRQHHRRWSERQRSRGSTAAMTTTLLAETLTRTSTSEAVLFWILGTVAVLGAIGM